MHHSQLLKVHYAPNTMPPVGCNLLHALTVLSSQSTALGSRRTGWRWSGCRPAVTIT